MAKKTTKTTAKKVAKKVTKSKVKAAVKTTVEATVQAVVKDTKSSKKVSTPVPVATAPPAVPAQENNLSDAFTELLGQLTSLRSQLTTITGVVRSLQKRTDRELKLAQKAGRRRARKSGNRAPSGFVKPTLISLELANFLGKDQGTEMARTAVTREINSYIRAHKLQDPKNGRRILPDTKLRKLLKVGQAEELTYFNLQRYMSPHFAKANQPFPAGAALLL
jgi:chromatin remodeling complex protein RSC6